MGLFSGMFQDSVGLTSLATLVCLIVIPVVIIAYIVKEMKNG